MSPAATITAEDADRALLRAADELFYAGGIARVTMANIRDEAGVSMRRLYALYPSKADLISGWLRQRHLDWITNLRTDVERRVEGGTPPLDAIFESLEAWVVATDFRGCGFINTHAERSDYTPDHHAIIRSHKQEVAALLYEFVPAVEGLSVLVDGALVQASIFANTSPIQSARQTAFIIQELRTP